MGSRGKLLKECGVPLPLCRLDLYSNFHPAQEQNERHDPKNKEIHQLSGNQLTKKRSGGFEQEMRCKKTNKKQPPRPALKVRCSKIHTNQKLLKNTVLPVLYVLFDAGNKYVDNKQSVVSQALPHPEPQLGRLPEQRFQSGEEDKSHGNTM